MNTRELEAALSGLPKKIKTVGVFACDQIPRRLALPACVIINLDTSTLPGSHWVALYIDGKSRGYFFDSYGRAPRERYILEALKNNCKMWWHSKKQLQSFDSQVCGEYCVQFLHHMAKFTDTTTFMTQFSKNTRLNDKKTSKFFRQYKRCQVLKKKITRVNTYPGGRSSGGGSGGSASDSKNQACVARMNYFKNTI